jgi:hypothetical protein
MAEIIGIWLRNKLPAFRARLDKPLLGVLNELLRHPRLVNETLTCVLLYFLTHDQTLVSL